MRPDQKDSDTLPPYDVLDAILEDYVEELHSAEQIAKERGFDLGLVRRVLRMVDRAEYKRQQAAPGIKISEKAFGYGTPLSDCSKVGGLTASRPWDVCISTHLKGTHAP